MLLADALDWDPNSEFLIYDALNSIPQAVGDPLIYWDVNLLEPDLELIIPLFAPLPAGLHLGNPAFAKTNEAFVVFDLFDERFDRNEIWVYDLFSGQVSRLEGTGASIGFPSFSPDDGEIIFQFFDEGSQLLSLARIPLLEGRLERAGETQVFLTGAQSTEWFAAAEPLEFPGRPIDRHAEISLGETTTGALLAAGRDNRQSFVFEVTQLQSIRFTLRADFSKYLRLYDPVDAETHFSSRRQSRSEAGRSRLRFEQSLGPGVYRIEVGSVGDRQLGSFELETGPAITGTFAYLEIGDSVMGDVDRVGQSGRQSVMLVVGTPRRVRFVVEADFRPNPVIYSTATGHPVVEGLAKSGSTTADIQQYLQTGIYRIEVASVGDLETGNFTLETLPGRGAAKPLSLLDADTQSLSAYPNPFNSSLVLTFSVAEASEIHLDIYNSIGQLVRTLIGQAMLPGRHTAHWNGSDDSGHMVSTGVYFVRLAVGADHRTMRITVLR